MSYLPSWQIRERSSVSTKGNVDGNQMYDGSTRMQNPFHKCRLFKPITSNSRPYQTDTHYQNSVNYLHSSHPYKHNRSNENSHFPTNSKYSPFKNSDSFSSSPFQVNTSLSSRSQRKESSPYQKVYAYQPKKTHQFSKDKLNRSQQKFYRPKIYSSFQSQNRNLKRVLANSPFHQFGAVQSSQILNSKLHENFNTNQVKYMNNPFGKKHLVSSFKENENVSLKQDYYLQNHTIMSHYKPSSNEEYFSGVRNNGYVNSEVKDCNTSSNGTYVQRLQPFKFFSNDQNQLESNVENKVLIKGISMTQRNPSKKENGSSSVFQTVSFKSNASCYSMKFGQNNGLNGENVNRRNESKVGQDSFQLKQSTVYNSTGKFPQLVSFQNKKYRLVQQL